MGRLNTEVYFPSGRSVCRGGGSQLSGSNWKIPGPEITRSLQPFVYSLIKRVSNALWGPGTVLDFGDEELSEM